jgi:hypothetical protein
MGKNTEPMAVRFQQEYMSLDRLAARGLGWRA